MQATGESRRGAFGWRLLAAALVAGLVAGPPAWAQTTIRINDTEPFAQTTQNPCVGENVAFNGFAHIKQTIEERSDGTVRVISSIKVNAQGVGETTGLKYSIGLTQNTDAVFSGTGPLIVRGRTKVISQGKTSNFFATFVFSISSSGETTFTIEGDCRG
jgi:hypothetical protein